MCNYYVVFVSRLLCGSRKVTLPWIVILLNLRKIRSTRLSSTFNKSLTSKEVHVVVDHHVCLCLLQLIPARDTGLLSNEPRYCIGLANQFPIKLKKSVNIW